jgi:hypothetical protein
MYEMTTGKQTDATAPARAARPGKGTRKKLDPASEIRALMVEATRRAVATNDATAGTEDTLIAAYQRARGRVYGLAERLARRRRHTLPELVAMVMFAAWRLDTIDETDDLVWSALLRGLAGVDPDTVLCGETG